MNIQYMESALRQFKMYKQLGEKAIAQMSDDSLNWQANADSNSVANIVKHLHGNMLSRWTDFLTTDGEKEWRKRDEEFEPEQLGRAALVSQWEEGWKCMFNALEGLSDDDLTKIIYIRNQGHTVLEAIFRQVAHYSYHVGQIVYIAKLCSHDNRNSLSIPRNKSAEYNSEKFAKEKERKHFTDEFLKDGK